MSSTGSPKKSPKKIGKKIITGAATQKGGKKSKKRKTIHELIKGLNTCKTVRDLKSNLRGEYGEIAITRDGVKCIKQSTAEQTARILAATISTMGVYSKRTGAFKGYRSTIKRDDIIRGLDALEDKEKCIA